KTVAPSSFSGSTAASTAAPCAQRFMVKVEPGESAFLRKGTLTPHFETSQQEYCKAVELSGEGTQLAWRRVKQFASRPIGLAAPFGRFAVRLELSAAAEQLLVAREQPSFLTR